MRRKCKATREHQFCSRNYRPGALQHSASPSVSGTVCWCDTISSYESQRNGLNSVQIVLCSVCPARLLTLASLSVYALAMLCMLYFVVIITALQVFFVLLAELYYTYPSIHPLSITLSLNRVVGGAGADPSCHWASGGVHPGQIASLSQGWHIETGNHSHPPFTPSGNLESPVNLACMSLDCGRKPEYPEKIHSYSYTHTYLQLLMIQFLCSLFIFVQEKKHWDFSFQPFCWTAPLKYRVLGHCFMKRLAGNVFALHSCQLKS